MATSTDRASRLRQALKAGLRHATAGAGLLLRRRSREAMSGAPRLRRSVVVRRADGSRPAPDHSESTTTCLPWPFRRRRVSSIARLPNRSATNRAQDCAESTNLILGPTILRMARLSSG